ERGLDTKPRSSASVGWERSASRGCERVQPKRDRTILGSCARSLDQSPKTKRLIGAVGPKIEFEIGPCIETHAIESLVKRGGIEVPEAKTMSPKRAGGHDLQTVRSIGEVVERLGVSLVGGGMIKTGDDPPRTAGSNRSWAFRWRIDGFDPNVIR